jgi:hypothetical protein
MIVNFLFESIKGRYHLGNEKMAEKLIDVIFGELGCENEDWIQLAHLGYLQTD